MKKIILLVIAVIFFSNLHAQTKIGLRGGLTYNWIKAEFQSKVKPGIEGGLLANIPFTKTISLQPELVYSYQRFRHDVKFSNIEGEGGENLHYLYLPLLLKYRFAKRFFVEGGPQVGYLYKVEDVHPWLGKNDVTEYFKRVSFGASAGLSYQVNPVASVNARFYHSFTTAVEFSQVEFLRKMVQVGAALVF